jgi:predicted nucleotidyltransferase
MDQRVKLRLDMPSNSKVIESLVQNIVEAVHPLKIILFGSYARGKANPQSDIDVLVVMPEGVHCRRTAQLLYRQIKKIRNSF